MKYKYLYCNLQHNCSIMHGIAQCAPCYRELHNIAGANATGKGINPGCMDGWEARCKFKAQCKGTEGTQK